MKKKLGLLPHTQADGRLWSALAVHAGNAGYAVRVATPQDETEPPLIEIIFGGRGGARQRPIWFPTSVVCQSADALLCNMCASSCNAAASVDPASDVQILEDSKLSVADCVAATHRMLLVWSGRPESTQQCEQTGFFPALQSALIRHFKKSINDPDLSQLISAAKLSVELLANLNNGSQVVRYVLVGKGLTEEAQAAIRIQRTFRKYQLATAAPPEAAEEADTKPKIDASVSSVAFTDTDGDTNTFFTKDGKLIYQPQPGRELETSELRYDGSGRKIGAAGWSMTLQDDSAEVERVLAHLVKLAEDVGTPHNINLDSPCAPNCPDCSKTMEVTDTQNHSYTYSSYICNGCRASDRGTRWVCEDCRNDYCFECKPQTSDSGPENAPPDTRIPVFPLLATADADAAQVSIDQVTPWLRPYLAGEAPAPLEIQCKKSELVQPLGSDQVRCGTSKLSSVLHHCSLLTSLQHQYSLLFLTECFS